MSFFGNIFDFAKDSIGELAAHPLQTLGAVAGVPGYDPFFGGLLNNKPGGALISPTGNFTSSAWQDMYNRNPNDAGALNTFSGINSVADKVAPMIAGYYAAPGIGAALGSGAAGAAGAAGSGAGVGAGLAGSSAGSVGAGIGSETAGMAGAGMGTGAATWGGAAASPVVGSGTAGLFSSGAGAGGLQGLFSGPAALGDAGLSGAVSSGGSGLGLMGGANMGSALGSAPTGLFSGMLPGGGMSGTASGALGGGMSGDAAGASQIGGSTMGGYMPNVGQMLNQGQRIMQMQQQQQQHPQMMMQAPQQNRFGNQRPQQQGPIGPSMPYASFNGAAPMNNPFGFGSAYGTV